MKLCVLHLYYDIMNLYGEYGNVKILEKHLQDQGFEVEVIRKTLNDEIDFSQIDFIYIGAGTENNIKCVMEDMVKHRDKLNEYIQKDGLMLSTGTSIEMFGKKIDDNEALSVFDYTIKRTKERITTDVIYSSDILEKKVVGFVNKMSEMYDNSNHLFEVEFGIGENVNSNVEGVQYKNFLGTYLIGPLLIRNPELLELIVMKLCTKKNVEYVKKEYTNEEQGYELVLSELENRKQKKD